MTLSGRIYLWTPLCKLLGLSADRKSSIAIQPRTLTFQMVESEVSVADALLDLGDLAGCDQHMSIATENAEVLRGPENMLMHQRLRQLRQKRAEFRSLR